jgi:hypothetical protein
MTSVLARHVAIGTLLLAPSLVGCEPSDNVSWVIVSNPSGGSGTKGGGAVIVIRRTGSSPAGTGGGGAFSVSGVDGEGSPVTVFLPENADLVAIAHAELVDLRSPLLGPRRAELPGARVRMSTAPAFALELDVPSTETLDERAFGRGTVHIAREGGLLVIEHEGGVLALGDAAGPEVAPPGTRVDGEGLLPVLITPDHRARVLHPPAFPPPESRLRPSATRGGIELLGPYGEVLAVLPENRVQLHGGAAGLFLTAAFPEGLGRSDPTPMSLTMAAQNRFLLRVDER